MIVGYLSIMQIYYINEDYFQVSKQNVIQKEYETLKMDGKEWIGTIISNEKLSSDTTDQFEWTMAYCVEDFFMIPLKLINLLDKKVCIYGEVINCNIHTELGECKYFIKVRSIISQ